MKNRVIILIICLLVLAFVISSLNCVDMGDFQDGKVVFIYKDAHIQSNLTQTDMEKIEKLFDGKLLFRDMPACGFHKSVSLQFRDGEQVFCIACDGCGLIYWENKDKYFKLSAAEISALHEVLKEYGMYFPCI